MILALVVAVLAGVGSVARYATDRIVALHVGTDRPWGTLAVNVSGSLVLGLVLGFGWHHGVSSSLVTSIGVGFCGGFTTFSTWMVETITLAEAGERAAAALNIAVTVGLGLAAAAAGFGLALV